MQNDGEIKKVGDRFNQRIVRHEIRVEVKRNPGVLCQ